MIGLNILVARYDALIIRRAELESQYDDDPSPVAEGRLVANERKLSACRRAIRMEKARHGTTRKLTTEVACHV